MEDRIIIPDNIRPYVTPSEIPGMPIEPYPEEEIHPTKEWLEDAIPLDVYGSNSYTLNRVASFILHDIKNLIKVSSKPRTIEAIKTIVTNLFMAKLESKPVRYSRNKNHYTRDRRYGKLFLKYDRIIPIVDAMERMGYIHQKAGFYISDIGKGKQTRMWGTPHLWSILQYHSLVGPHFYYKARPEELVVLRDENKHEIGYRETRITKMARADLEQYNKFVEEHTITVRLDKSTIITRRFLIEFLYRNILNHTISISQITVNPNPIILSQSITQYNTNPISITKPHQYNNYPIIQILQSYSIPPTMTNTNCGNRLIELGLRDFYNHRNMLMNYLQELSSDVAILEDIDAVSTLLDEKFNLSELGLSELEIELHHECLHRVFNRKLFKKGGRAYGALHQNMPKHLRPLMQINGEKTVEIDFSGYHILMLYHMEGINYQEDPYRVCGGDENLREAYKIVGLVAINAGDEKEAVGAIRDKLKKNGIPLPEVKNPVKSLIRAFKDAHKPIQKYLLSDVGVMLQNTDSHIMNTILMRLMDYGILGLSVYDSVIVAEKCRDVLRQIMVEAYEDVMGFKPRF